MCGSLRLAVTGKPVVHSKSPDIFKKIFEKDMFSGFYSRIAADSMEEAVRISGIISLNGINVTSPFKEEAFSIAEIRKESSELLKASNTLCFYKKNSDSKQQIISDNTDPYGVLSAVLKSFPRPEGLKALVIGAGGAGIAACYALSKAGFKTVLVNRTVEKARQKSKFIINCSAEKIENIDFIVKDAALIIHTLPVKDYFFNPDLIMKGAVLFDANYKYSPLKDLAHRKGLDYIDGRKWLLGQAEAACKIFLENAALKEQKKYALSGCERIKDSVFLESLCFKNISLIGFMGCGKTETGKFLSKLTGYDFMDTDSVIEKMAGMSISKIFEKKGEAYFRNMESNAVTEILKNKSRKIISCGGGSPVNSQIHNALKKYSLPVWLLASPEVSLSRIKDNTRPLLDTGRKREKAVKLFNDRIDIYGSASELIINTESRSAEEVAGRIYEEISEFI